MDCEQTTLYNSRANVKWVYYYWHSHDDPYHAVVLHEVKIGLAVPSKRHKSLLELDDRLRHLRAQQGLRWELRAQQLPNVNLLILLVGISRDWQQKSFDGSTCAAMRRTISSGASCIAGKAARKKARYCCACNDFVRLSISIGRRTSGLNKLDVAMRKNFVQI